MARLARTLALVLLTGCPPIMIERDGHEVFNPFYTGFLDSTERDAWQKPDQVMNALGLTDGSVVADVGAGSGWFAERFSRRVGGAGRVYATDVQDAMLERLHARVAARGLHNVHVVQAAFDDPALPDACCDVIFFSSVYNEIDGRGAYVRKIDRALRRHGRVAILEYRPDARGHGPPRAMRLDADVVVAELASAGFALAARHDFIDRQYLLVFTRDVTRRSISARGRTPR